MKVLLSILSICFLSTMWLGPQLVSGAQLLSDDDLDQVTAAGTNWNVEFFDPTSAILGAPTTTTSQIQTTTALNSALSSVSAAAASAEAAKVVKGVSGLAVASSAVSTAATALDTVAIANGLDTLNLGKSTLSAAADLINSIPIEQHTPELMEAAKKVNEAAFNLNQAALDSSAIELNSAVKAVEAAKVAINALPEIGGEEIDHSKAIDAAVDSIQFAKKAINTATEKQTATVGRNSTFVLKENGDGSLDPVLRINFSSGKTVGSADIIPLVTRGGPSQPGLGSLNLDGAAIVNGQTPLTLIAETLMMNMNICYACVADKIIQNNNGYIVPIYVK